MKTITELAEKWNSISPYSDGFLLVSDDHPLSFHIGIQAENEKVFVVLNTGKIDKIFSSKSVLAENIRLENGSYALRFWLKQPSLDELFVKLCWDLMEASRYAKDPLKQFVAQYKKWQRLLQQVNNGLLSDNVQKGLIGELLFLKEKADQFGVDAALTAWTGPEGSDQDFDFPDFWAEVKSTAISSQAISISSIQQLDRSDKGLLVVYYLDKTTAAGKQCVSLDEAIKSVEQMLVSEKQKNSFACKLARLGYQEKDRKLYHETRFRVQDRDVFSVVEGFPRLIKSNIISGIVNVNYEISLSAIKAFKKQEI
ncbi:MAG: PD-(D/E)XK motif protein [Clostridia bacterium]|nr:PD-(D/E)XK motif protein [Clostridia bacterium]